MRDLLDRLRYGLAALTQRLPRVNWSAVRERIPSFRLPLPAVSARLPLLDRLNWALVRKLLLLAFVIVLVAVLGGLMAARGFRPPAIAAAIPDELAQLRFSGEEVILWHALEDPADEMLTQLVDEFNATNAWGITVVPQGQGTYTRLRQRLDRALARGAVPDLVALYPHHTASYALDSAVVPLDEYLDHPEFGLTRADLNDFVPGLLEGGRNPQFDDQLMSFPIGPNVMVLVYNLDWLRSIGHQDPPATWETFEEICRQAVTDVNGDGAPDTFGYAFVPDAPTFSALVLTRGGELISADGRQVLFNSSEGRRAIRTLYDMHSSRCTYSAPQPDWDRGKFAREEVLFNIVSSSALPGYLSAIERGPTFRWGVAPLPHGDPEPVTPLFGQNWAVLRTTPSRQTAAWLFVRWFAEARQTQRWALANYTVPVRRSAVEALRGMEDLDPALVAVLDLATYGRPVPSVSGWEAVGRSVVEAMRAVFEGVDPEEALAQAEEAANAILSGR